MTNRGGLPALPQWGGAFSFLVSKQGQVTWTKGQSGNPKGNVGKHSIRAALRKMAARKRPDGSTYAEEVARLGMQAALGADLDAIKWVTDQVDGKLPQPVEQSGGLEVVVRRADRNR